MGWKSFETLPPDGELVHVYAEDDKGGFWIYTAQWDAERQCLVEIDISIRYSDNARVLCWQKRPALPKEHVVRQLRTLPPVKMAD